MKYEYALYLFVILMIIVFLVDYYLINKKRLYLITNKGKNKKGKNKKIKNIGELDYLIMKFKLDKKKINQNKAIFWIAIINSFIISSVSCVIMLIPLKLMWQMLIAFALLFALIYSIYEIYGRHLKKEEEK
ncbi:MAG: hypothetical protein HFI36_02380 [Bacilli bacterium]|jgi:purine-cytosine permease-like protein|nr:hypothetical protein [Bacilli bacterium]MCX4254387.1 hypothetical protein [Bacilli bacterium]